MKARAAAAAKAKATAAAEAKAKAALQEEEHTSVPQPLKIDVVAANTRIDMRIKEREKMRALSVQTLASSKSSRWQVTALPTRSIEAHRAMRPSYPTLAELELPEELRDWKGASSAPNRSFDRSNSAPPAGAPAGSQPLSSRAHVSSASARGSLKTPLRSSVAPEVANTSAPPQLSLPMPLPSTVLPTRSSSDLAALAVPTLAAVPTIPVSSRRFAPAVTSEEVATPAEVAVGRLGLATHTTHHHGGTNGNASASSVSGDEDDQHGPNCNDARNNAQLPTLFSMLDAALPSARAMLDSAFPSARSLLDGAFPTSARTSHSTPSRPRSHTSPGGSARGGCKATTAARISCAGFGGEVNGSTSYMHRSDSCSHGGGRCSVPPAAWAAAAEGGEAAVEVGAAAEAVEHEARQPLLGGSPSSRSARRSDSFESSGSARRQRGDAPAHSATRRTADTASVELREAEELTGGSSAAQLLRLTANSAGVAAAVPSIACSARRSARPPPRTAEVPQPFGAWPAVTDEEGRCCQFRTRRQPQPVALPEPGTALSLVLYAPHLLTKPKRTHCSGVHGASSVPVCAVPIKPKDETMRQLRGTPLGMHHRDNARPHARPSRLRPCSPPPRHPLHDEQLRCTKSGGCRGTFKDSSTHASLGPIGSQQRQQQMALWSAEAHAYEYAIEPMSWSASAIHTRDPHRWGEGDATAKASSYEAVAAELLNSRAENAAAISHVRDARLRTPRRSDEQWAEWVVRAQPITWALEARTLAALEHEEAEEERLLIALQQERREQQRELDGGGDVAGGASIGGGGSMNAKQPMLPRQNVRNGRGVVVRLSPPRTKASRQRSQPVSQTEAELALRRQRRARSHALAVARNGFAQGFASSSDEAGSAEGYDDEGDEDAGTNEGQLHQEIEPPSDTRRWYYLGEGDARCGPIEWSELQQLRYSGTIGPQSQVYCHLLGSTWTMVFELDLEGPEPVADEPLMEMEESQEAYRDVTHAKLLQA